MKNFVLLLVVLLGSSCLYSQIGRIEFVDGTIGYVIDQNLSKHGLGDTLTFESLDQKVWRIAQIESDPFLTLKKGVIQRMALPNKEWCAKVTLVNSKKTDLIDDFSLALFSVGDTIQMIKRIDSQGEEICRVYFGQLPGKNPEEGQSVVIKKIFQMK